MADRTHIRVSWCTLNGNHVRLCGIQKKKRKKRKKKQRKTEEFRLKKRNAKKKAPTQTPTEAHYVMRQEKCMATTWPTSVNKVIRSHEKKIHNNIERLN